MKKTEHQILKSILSKTLKMITSGTQAAAFNMNRMLLTEEAGGLAGGRKLKDGPWDTPHN